MALPVQDQAAQEIRPAQERTVERRRAANYHVVAAAGTGVLAVNHELVGTEPRLPGFLVDAFGDRDTFLPAGCRMDVDLDDARIRCNADDIHARVGRGGYPSI